MASESLQGLVLVTKTYPETTAASSILLPSLGLLQREGACAYAQPILGRPAAPQPERSSPDRGRRCGLQCDALAVAHAMGRGAACHGQGGRPHEIGGLEDHLLVMLVYERCYVTQQFLGFFYKVESSAVCRAIERTEAMVKPLYGVCRTPRLTRREAEAVIIDCTEQPIERPGEEAIQREHYSGKNPPCQ